ncbi:MAG: hypothetical protein JXI43_09760 [Tissierellales bacterium]|nr:hypothetical protein [Tissierellales bacterium]
MTKKLFIHIGLMKTGSSSIQQTLYKNNKILKSEYSINYPISLHHHNMNIFPVFKENPQEFPDWKRQYSVKEAMSQQKQCLAIFKRELVENQQDVFVISSELFGFLSEKEISEMKHFCEPYFDEIQVLIYVRHPISFIPSLIKQDILNGFNPEQLELDSFIEKYKYKVEYQSIIRKYVQVYSSENIIFKNFDSQFFYNGNLMEDFFCQMGKSVDLNKLEVTIENEALKQYSTLFLSEYNKKYPIIINNKRNYNRGLSSRWFPERIYKSIEDKKFDLNIIYTEDEALYLNEEINYVNQYLKSNEKFEVIIPTLNQIEPMDVHSIPTDYFVELINEYNKYLENLYKKMERLEKIENIEKMNFLTSIYQLSGKRLTRKFKNKIYLMLHKTHQAFDETYYCHEYPEISSYPISPFAHFVMKGVYEGKNPNPNFNTLSILKMHPELLLKGKNPLFIKKYANLNKKG